MMLAYGERGGDAGMSLASRGMCEMSQRDGNVKMVTRQPTTRLYPQDRPENTPFRKECTTEEGPGNLQKPSEAVLCK